MYSPYFLTKISFWPHILQVEVATDSSATIHETSKEDNSCLDTYNKSYSEAETPDNPADTSELCDPMTATEGGQPDAKDTTSELNDQPKNLIDKGTCQKEAETVTEAETKSVDSGITSPAALKDKSNKPIEPGNNATRSFSNRPRFNHRYFKTYVLEVLPSVYDV